MASSDGLEYGLALRGGLLAARAEFEEGKMSCAALLYNHFMRYSAFSSNPRANVATRRLNYTPSIIHPLEISSTYPAIKLRTGWPPPGTLSVSIVSTVSP